MSTATRGFASMTPERRRELAKKGAERQGELGQRYKFTSDAARAAGRLGGLRTQARRRAGRSDTPSEA